MADGGARGRCRALRAPCGKHVHLTHNQDAGGGRTIKTPPSYKTQQNHTTHGGDPPAAPCSRACARACTSESKATSSRPCSTAGVPWPTSAACTSGCSAPA
eukprot:3862348-Prymnesium_polylepis.1